MNGLYKVKRKKTRHFREKNDVNKDKEAERRNTCGMFMGGWMVQPE